jgi:rRNA maturation protein Nop10
MALTKCRECGHEISTLADKCPNCGAPRIFSFSTNKSGEESRASHPESSSPKTAVIHFLIVVGILFVLAIIVFAPRYTTTPTASPRYSESVSEEQQLVDKRQTYVQRLKREHEGLRSFKVDTYLDSRDSIVLGTALFSVCATLAEEGNNYELDEAEKKLLSAFKKQLSKTQAKAFPRLRDAYGPAVRRMIWEHDMSAKTFGSGYRTIEIVGGVFAANRNIKEFQTKVRDSLRQLRFRQSRYKWYAEADEYTYYDIDSPEDSVLIIWASDSQYRKVQRN